MIKLNFLKISVFVGVVVIGVFLSFSHSNAFHVGGHNPGHLFISGDRDYCFTMSGVGSGPDAGPYPRCTTQFKDWYWSTMVEGTWTVEMDRSYIPPGWTVSGSGICYNGGGTNCSVYVTFTPPPSPPTVSISASPGNVAYNGTSTISWSVSGSASQCYAGGSYPTWQGAIGTSGYSSTTYPLTESHYFTVRCDGPGGSSSTERADVTVQPRPNQVPGGFLDDANCSTISGWAYDPDAPSTSINVHIYKEDGTKWGYTTDVHRGDVNAAYSDPSRDYYVTGNHGFSVATPDAFKDGKTHTVTAYAIDSSGGANAQLGNSPKSIYCPPPTGTIIVNSVDVDDLSKTVPFPDGILSRTNPDYQWTQQGWPHTYTGVDGMAYGEYNTLLPYTEISTHKHDHTDPPRKQTLSSGQQTIVWTIYWKNKTPTASITCNGSSSTNVSYGGSARIDWTSNARSCTVAPTGWSRPSGSETVTNLTSSQTYTLTCNN